MGFKGNVNNNDLYTDWSGFFCSIHCMQDPNGIARMYGFVYNTEPLRGFGSRATSFTLIIIYEDQEA